MLRRPSTGPTATLPPRSTGPMRASALRIPVCWSGTPSRPRSTGVRASPDLRQWQCVHRTTQCRDKSTLTPLKACSRSDEPLSVLSRDRHPVQMLGDARAKAQPAN
eukprot:1525368-Alexandrium_andersonii.AAC.1